jgi:hypothetical protein
LRGAADAQIEVIRNGEERAAVIDKQKDGSGEGDQFGFRLNIVEIDTDEDGEPITSCVIQAGDNKAASVAAVEKKAGDGRNINQKVALDVATSICETAGEPVEGDTLVNAIVLKLALENPDASPKHRKQRAKEALEGLARAGIFTVEDDKYFPASRFPPVPAGN